MPTSRLRCSCPLERPRLMTTTVQELPPDLQRVQCTLCGISSLVHVPRGDHAPEDSFHNERMTDDGAPPPGA